MVQQIVDNIGDLDASLVPRFQSSSFRRRYRRKRKDEMRPSLRAEAKEASWRFVRSLLNELVENMRRRGYRPDTTRTFKFTHLKAEYSRRTEELVSELYQRPDVLSEVFSPAKTLGYVRARNAWLFFDNTENYYSHIISLIYQIRRGDKIKLSRRHAGDFRKQLAKALPCEARKLIDGFVRNLNSPQVDETRVKILVNELVELLSQAQDRIFPSLPVVMRYCILGTIPRIPADAASSCKQLRLQPQTAEQIADGQESIGASRWTSRGRKQVYKPRMLAPLEDEEHLERFAHLAGINLNDLTAGEQRRLLDLMNACDMGYELASKRGLSLADYYGDRADSEKTQRYRLFEKIKVHSRPKD